MNIKMDCYTNGDYLWYISAQRCEEFALDKCKIEKTRGCVKMSFDYRFALSS